MVRIKNSKSLTVKMDQNKKMGCPRCSSLIKKQIMRKVKHPSGAILDVCDKCGGMWLDKEEVKLLYDFSKSKTSKTKKVKK